MTKWICGTRLRVTTINKLKWAYSVMEAKAEKPESNKFYFHMHCEQWLVDGSIPFVRWSSFADGQPWFESTSSAVENRNWSVARMVRGWIANPQHCEVISSILIPTSKFGAVAETVSSASLITMSTLVRFQPAPPNMALSSSGKDTALSRRRHGFDPRWGYQNYVQVGEWLKPVDCNSAAVIATLVRIQPCTP